MTVRPCPDGTPAQWLLEQKLDWCDLVTRGPRIYGKYARLLFIPDPQSDGQRETDVDFLNDGLPEVSQIGVAVSTLAHFTATPGHCYYLIWDGYGDLDRFGAARVPIPERPCNLFEGTAHDLTTWTDARDDSGELSIPAFVWPADRAWCIANDVDPHFATIGATGDAISALSPTPASTPPRTTRPDTRPRTGSEPLQLTPTT